MPKKVKKKVAEPVAPKEAEAAKPVAKLAPARFEDSDFSRMANIVKARRAFNACAGRAKPQSNEGASFAKRKGEGLKGQELYEAVYADMGGLLSAEKAKANRANEKKAAKERSGR